MKGSSRIGLRVRVMMIFAVTFVAGAIVIFGTVALAGAALRLDHVPLVWRAGFAALVLGTLGLVDVLAVRRNTYCPLGIARQTPKFLLRRYKVTTVAAAWGFDTGLAITTIRVAAITWGALVMVALGVSSWWIGLGYGLGFVVPLLYFLVTPDGGSGAQASLGSRLEGLLLRRAVAQSASAVLLFTAGAVLLISLILPD